MGSTSSASAKDGERTRNMQRHMALASGRPVTTISCIKILSSWPNEAKNSCVLRLLISVIYVGQHEAPLDGAGCRISRACSTPPGQAKPLLSMSGQHRRDAQRRTATSVPKTALPPFLVETVNIAGADPGLFHAFGRLDRGGVLLGDADATNVQMAGQECTCVASSRRCVQHAQCRHIAERRADGAAIDWRTARCPTDAGLGQTRRAEGASDVRRDLGTRQAARCARKSRGMHAGTRRRQADVQSVMIG